MILRFYNLGLRPFHHDEAVHGWFTLKILNTGDYHYQPWAHGPLQYYLTTVVFYLFGTTEFTGRVIPAIIGVLLVASAYPLRRYIGKNGSLFLALFFAISPSILYYSRFFRNDIYIALFAILILIAILRYVDTKKLYWAVSAGIIAALAASTKENAYIVLFIFVSFAILYLIRERGHLKIREIIKTNLPAIISAGIAGLFVYFLLYSFFLQHPSDPFHAIPDALDHWSNYTGGPSGPFYFYIPLMILYELPILLFGILGIIYYWFREKGNVMMLFLSYYFAVSMIIHASIHEKAPWLTIHLILPLAIIAASYLDKLMQMDWNGTKKILTAILGITLVFMAANSLALNYIRFVDPAEPMIQAAQPDMRFAEMMAVTERVAAGIDGYNTSIIVTDNKLETQLLWKLRDFKKIRWRVNINSTLDAPLIFVHDLDADVVEANLEREGYSRMDARILQWYWWKRSDVTLRFILFREMDRASDGYGVVLFYKGE
ncbi:MAG: glycosyl transferase [Candidatus Syntrophoarchaeum caldarius]|uniref:Glycosyl transferase n=1 Tax=Candidatus Syntropharchaeum caldarium TaxID=1838285 RepID=A0A1F2P909_9EURY|nr:MAG: glycosyl transferase [Candidatus Syntrophoarchaeum caldarius]